MPSLKEAIAIVYTTKGDSVFVYTQDQIEYWIKWYEDNGRTVYVFRKDTNA